ncbi:MAG: hypothetical protein RBS01_03250 [Candidatus Dojkabacteria bacterium]|jgi:hypothetical protein|nr:hypothetical protein [Candidatus Dojkabacteria bacterium]
MKGYVALTTVLVILPILLLTGIDSLYRNMTTLITGKMTYDSHILKSHSETCLEETVYKIKRNITYTGTSTLSLDNWSCNIEVEDKLGNPGIKIITIEATDDIGTYYFIQKELNINVDPFEISNT